MIIFFYKNPERHKAAKRIRCLMPLADNLWFIDVFNWRCAPPFADKEC